MSSLVTIVLCLMTFETPGSMPVQPAPQGMDLTPQRNVLRELNNAIASAWQAPNPTVRQYAESFWNDFQIIRDSAQFDWIPDAVQKQLSDDAQLIAGLAQQVQLDEWGMADLNSLRDDLRLKAQAAQTSFPPPSFIPDEPPTALDAAPDHSGNHRLAGGLPSRTQPGDARQGQFLQAAAGTDLGVESTLGAHPQPVAGLVNSRESDVDVFDPDFIDVSVLPFPPQPAKAMAEGVVMADQWVRAVSIITRVQDQEKVGVNVYYLDRGQISGPVPGDRLKLLGQSAIEAMKLPWGAYLLFATEGNVPAQVTPQQFSRIDVQVYPDQSLQKPLTFKIEAR